MSRICWPCSRETHGECREAYNYKTPCNCPCREAPKPSRSFRAIAELDVEEERRPTHPPSYLCRIGEHGGCRTCSCKCHSERARKQRVVAIAAQMKAIFAIESLREDFNSSFDKKSDEFKAAARKDFEPLGFKLGRRR